MSSWTADLPRAALRAALLAAVCGVGVLLLQRAVGNMGGRGALGVADLALVLAAGAWTIPLTLLEGRLAARRERPGAMATLLGALWPAASLLALAAAANGAWVGGVLDGGFDGGLAALEDLLARVRRSPGMTVLALALLGGGQAAASLAALEGGATRMTVAVLGVFCLLAVAPGVAILAPLVAFTLADVLAARLSGGPRAQRPEVALLERLVRDGTLPRSRAWLLAYLGDPVARAVVEGEPAPTELGAWLERLDRGGRFAGARAALAAARLVLPRLRALHPDDLRADAVVVAVDAWLAAPQDAALADVRAALSLLAIPGPEADAVRAAALACEGNDRWAARNAAQQAVAAGQAVVAAGHEPDAVRTAVAEALRAWAEVPGLAATPTTDAAPTAPTASPLATLAAAFTPAPPPPRARFVLWREDDDGARHQVETFTDEREADDARRTFDATGHKQRYWVERA